MTHALAGTRDEDALSCKRRHEVAQPVRESAFMLMMMVFSAM
jgi:hypothetical protein